MSFLGELHGIGDEVGEHLMHPSDVEGGDKRVVGVLLLELHGGFLYTLRQGETDILEGSGEIHLLRFDGDRTVGEARCLDDIVDKSLEHIARVTDDTHVFGPFRGVAEGFEHTGEADDGVQRGTQFVSHRSHEGTLHTDTVLCSFRLLCQLPTGVGYPGDIGGDALVTDDPALLVEDGVEGGMEHHALLPFRGLDDVEGIFLRRAGGGVVENVHHCLTVFRGEQSVEARETVFIFGRLWRAVEGDGLLFDVAAHEEPFTVDQQVVQLVVLQVDAFLSRGTFLLQQMHFSANPAGISDIEDNTDIVGNVTVGIEERLDVRLDIAVDAELLIYHVLTEEDIVARVAIHGTTEEGDVEHAHILPVVLGVVGATDAAEFLHGVVEADEVAVLVVERHGDKRDIRQDLVLMDEIAGGLVFFHFLRHVVDGIDDICRMTVAVEFGDGMPVEVEPFGLFLRTCVPPFVEFEIALTTFHQVTHLLFKLQLLVGVDAIRKLLERQTAFGQDLAITVCKAIADNVVLHDDEIAHMEGLSHHLVEFSERAGSILYMTTGQTTEEIEDGKQGQCTDDDIEPDETMSLLNALGMEPTVLDDGNLTALLQTGVLVIDLFYQLAVCTDDVDLGDGNAHIVEVDAFKVQFLDLPFQGFLAPDIVFVVAVEQTHQSHLRGLELHECGAGGVSVEEVTGGVVAGFEDGSLALQLLESYHASGVGMGGHADAVVVDDIVGDIVRLLAVAAGIGKDNVSILALEGLQGSAPLLHDELDGDVEFLHHSPHDIDVTTTGLAFVIQKLIRRLVPVAYYRNWSLVVVLIRQRLRNTGDK